MTDGNSTKRIWIVAHDFSPNADAAARIAAEDLLHGDSDATFLLCHVYQVMPLRTGFDGAVPGAGLISLERAVAVESARRLERAAESLRVDIGKMREKR